MAADSAGDLLTFEREALRTAGIERVARHEAGDRHVVELMKPPQREPAFFDVGPRIFVLSFGIDRERIGSVSDRERHGEEEMGRRETLFADAMQVPRLVPVRSVQLFEAGRADAAVRRAGEAALRRGEVGVITYAAGVGSRWTQGAGVVKGARAAATSAGV